MSSNIRLKGKGVNRIITSKVMLSPLAGVTDNIFRRLVRKWAPNSLLFTEMINATSLKKGYGTQKINQIDLDEGPIGVQIFDNRPYAVSEAAKQAEDSGAFLIDINMGCPVKKIAKKGGGSALIKDRKLAIELVKNVVKAVRVPVTVKTRLGWDNKEENIKLINSFEDKIGIFLGLLGSGLVVISLIWSGKRLFNKENISNEIQKPSIKKELNREELIEKKDEKLEKFDDII